MPAFMARLAEEKGTGARALEFTILTAARSGEVRGARWSEIDLPAALWVVPGERMKAGAAASCAAFVRRARASRCDAPESGH